MRSLSIGNPRDPLPASSTGVTSTRRPGRNTLNFSWRGNPPLWLLRGEKTGYQSTPAAAEYIGLVSSRYQKLFDATP
ncbi:MAG: hypothetical protein EH225_11690 [Calditrichaeota bacterium]|nr:MAG: hypothetical protein EH225_11690 [Calditrichota bacterium]